VTQNDIPEEVVRLIDGVIASMDHVEVLLRLDESAETAVSPDDLTRGGSVDRRDVRRVLGDLETAGFVRRLPGGTFAYVASGEERRAVQALAQMYQTRPVTLIRAVYSRATPLRTFNDVFRPDTA
jgi:hypothetical protein